MADTQVTTKHRCLRCSATQKRKVNIRRNADALTTLFFELAPGYENYLLRLGCEYRGTPFCCGQRQKSE